MKHFTTMKRFIYASAMTLALTACGGGEETDVATEPTVDTTAILEMETATEEVASGLQDLENTANELGSEVDSLLEGI